VTSGRHLQSQIWGRQAESWASAALRVKGYRILQRNYRVPVGEIDIIACRGTILGFIEVKARRNLAEGDVVEQQWQRIARAAEWFVMRHRRFSHFDWRFDVVIVRPWSWPRHLTDAWRPGGRPGGDLWG
jgi:putative endonuclease